MFGKLFVLPLVEACTRGKLYRGLMFLGGWNRWIGFYLMEEPLEMREPTPARCCISSAMYHKFIVVGRKGLSTLDRGWNRRRLFAGVYESFLAHGDGEKVRLKAG